MRRAALFLSFIAGGAVQAYLAARQTSEGEHLAALLLYAGVAGWAVLAYACLPRRRPRPGVAAARPVRAPQVRQGVGV